MSAATATWSDLRARVLSALVLIALGGLDLWVGGIWLQLLIALVAGLCTYETARMTAKGNDIAPIVVGAVAAVAVFLAGWMHSPLSPFLLMLPLAVGLVLVLRTRLFAVFSIEIGLGAHGISLLAMQGGAIWVLWLVCVIAASDVLGYFAGRALGGPKFWPRVSPKKTWSGTLAGWLGALAVGVAFGYALGRGWDIWLIGMSLLLGIAGQAGDIAESALKRASGVKDSSALIPGHGGVFDRFDAVLGAGVVMFFVLTFGQSWL